MKKKMIIKLVILIGIITLAACSNDEPESTESQSQEMDVVDAQSVVQISPTYFLLEDITEMAYLATHVTRGEILDVRTEWVDTSIPREVIVQDMLDEGMTQDEIDYELYGFDFESDFQLMTIYLIQVIETFQGDHIGGDIIEVMSLGGEYGDEIWYVENTIELMIGAEYILFLYTSGLVDQPYVLVSHVQGAYYVPDEVMLEDTDILDADTDDNGLDLELELAGASEQDPVTLTIEDLIEIADDNNLIETADDSDLLDD